MDTLILQEIELTYKVTQPVVSSRLQTPAAIYDLLFSQWNQDTISLFEEFKVLYLNRSNLLLGICTHSKGGISGTVVDNRLIMATALKCAASGIILAHNHPSGRLKPSAEDIQITQKLKACCQMFDISLVDHIIVAKKGFYSFREEGPL